MTDQTWDEFQGVMRSLADLAHIGSLMGWDQQTMMPPKGASARGKAMGTLASIRHEKMTDPKFGGLLEELQGQELPEERRVMVTRMQRLWDLETKLPAELVSELAEATSTAHFIWAEARQKSDFDIFAPHLENIFELITRRAELFGYDKEPYDAHLDLFEKGTKTADVEPVFEQVASKVKPLLDKVLAKDTSDWDLPKTPEHLDELLEYSRSLVEKMGFDMQAGRLDLTTHPFCSGTDPGDVRLTTRVDANNPKECLLATIHEMGHGLYQQGIPEAWLGTSIGTYISLGVHESQSRLWENHVGRSLPFWEGEALNATKALPPWKGLTPEMFFKGVNRVSDQSYIRVEADELTYPMHVILRFEMEIAISRGELKVRDLPTAWNEAMERHLGITPPDDAKGVLQDVHWSSGLFGYFPTYLLGSIYSASLFDKATEDLGGQATMDDNIRSGKFAPLLGWLREKIHQKGALLDPQELINSATGREREATIDIEPYTSYLTTKFESLYS